MNNAQNPLKQPRTFQNPHGWSVDEGDSTASKGGKTIKIYPECPHEEIDLSRRMSNKLYGPSLVDYLRKSIALP